jgi:hypothetical protein
MILRPIARNTTALTGTYTYASENPYRLTTQRVSNNDTSSSATSTSTGTPLLTHRNLVGILVIAALLALGLILWLCFGKWSKPIRHFLRGEQRQNNNNNSVRFGIGDRLAAVLPIDRPHRKSGTTVTGNSKLSKAAQPGSCDNAADSDVEKAVIVDSSSSSTQGSLDREGIEIDKDKELEPALPAKVRRPRRRCAGVRCSLTRGLAGTAFVYSKVWQSTCTSRSITRSRETNLRFSTTHTSFAIPPNTPPYPQSCERGHAGLDVPSTVLYRIASSVMTMVNFVLKTSQRMR